MLDRHCEWIPAKHRHSCGHSGREGPNPHIRLGTDVPTSVAAAYPEGLCEAWALEVARFQEDLRPFVADQREAAETAPRVRRHALRGTDPDSKREIRERENCECRKGLRNPQLCTADGARPQLKKTMGRVREFLLNARKQNPEFQNLTDALGPDPSKRPPSQAELAPFRA